MENEKDFEITNMRTNFVKRVYRINEDNYYYLTTGYIKKINEENYKRFAFIIFFDSVTLFGEQHFEKTNEEIYSFLLTRINNFINKIKSFDNCNLFLIDCENSLKIDYKDINIEMISDYISWELMHLLKHNKNLYNYFNEIKNKEDYMV